MSKLQELIREFCPDGVEYKKLGEIGTFTRGNGLQKKDFTESGVGCIHYGQIYTYYGTWATKTITYCSPRLAKKLRVAHKGDIVIATTSENVEDVCKAVAWLGDDDIVVSGDAYIFAHNQNPKYVSYIFQTQAFFDFKRKNQTGTKVIRVSGESMAKFEIPVPPLLIQEEIVRILDHFTELTASLQAELQARQEQYEYYRNRLLTFAKIGGGTQSVTWVKMSELFDIRNGYTPSKANAAYWENGAIPWFRMEDIRQNGRILLDSIQHITPAAVKGGRLFPANSFIIATTATIGEHALIIVDSLANQRFTNLQVRKSLMEKVDIKYLYYYMFIVGEWCRNNINVSGFASVDMKKFKKLLIPIPHLSEQQRIVSILDKFETFVNGLSQGLPAEIAAVQEQYEYYRNKLLTFNRIQSN